MSMAENKLYDCMHHLLAKANPDYEDLAMSDNATYTFFHNEDKSITYVLSKYDNQPYHSLSIMSDVYTDTIGLTRLTNYDTEKSQIFWDLLEMGGIRNYSFNLLLKNGIPNNDALANIDWDEVQV